MLYNKKRLDQKQASPWVLTEKLTRQILGFFFIEHNRTNWQDILKYLQATRYPWDMSCSDFFVRM